jgi:hypothetical protein
VQSDLFVSMPKLKTHHWAGMTASMKNLFGTVPVAVYGWLKNLLHARGIELLIIELAATIRPRLAIVDAVARMEGDGPIKGARSAVSRWDGSCRRGYRPMPNGRRRPAQDAAAPVRGVEVPWERDERRVEQRAELPEKHYKVFDPIPPI